MGVHGMTEGGVRNDMGWRNGGNHGWLSVYVSPLRLATLARVPLLLRKKGRERASFWLQKEEGFREMLACHFPVPASPAISLRSLASLSSVFLG